MVKVKFESGNEIDSCKVVRDNASYFHHNSIVRRNRNRGYLYNGEEEFDGRYKKRLEELENLRKGTDFRNHLIARIFITGIADGEEEKWESYIRTTQNNRSNNEEENARIGNDFFDVQSRDRDFLETENYIVDFVSGTEQPWYCSNQECPTQEYTYLYFPRTSDQRGEFWNGYYNQNNQRGIDINYPSFCHGDMSLFYTLQNKPWLFNNLLRENRDKIEITSTGVKIISTLDACNACHYAMVDQFGGIGGSIYNSLRRERNLTVNRWVPFYSLFHAIAPCGRDFSEERCLESYDELTGNWSCYGIKGQDSDLIPFGAYDTRQKAIFGINRDAYGKNFYWTQLPQRLVSRRNNFFAKPLMENNFEEGKVNYCILPFNENRAEQYQYQQACIIEQSRRG